MAVNRQLQMTNFLLAMQLLKPPPEPDPAIARAASEASRSAGLAADVAGEATRAAAAAADAAADVAVELQLQSDRAEAAAFEADAIARARAAAEDLGVTFDESLWREQQRTQREIDADQRAIRGMLSEAWKEVLPVDRAAAALRASLEGALEPAGVARARQAEIDTLLTAPPPRKRKDQWAHGIKMSQLRDERDVLDGVCERVEAAHADKQERLAELEADLSDAAVPLTFKLHLSHPLVAGVRPTGAETTTRGPTYVDIPPAAVRADIRRARIALSAAFDAHFQDCVDKAHLMVADELGADSADGIWGRVIGLGASIPPEQEAAVEYVIDRLRMAPPPIGADDATFEEALQRVVRHHVIEQPLVRAAWDAPDGTVFVLDNVGDERLSELRRCSDPKCPNEVLVGAENRRRQYIECPSERHRDFF